MEQSTAEKIAWADRFLARRKALGDSSTRDELLSEGMRMWEILGRDMTPEEAAEAMSSGWQRL